MIILDFLFKICLAPFAQYEEKGKLVAILALTQPLAFVLMSLLNIVTYWMRPLIEIHLSSSFSAATTCLLCFIVIKLLNNIYIKKKRETGNNYHAISGLLIPVLIVGSLIVFVMSLKYS